MERIDLNQSIYTDEELWGQIRHGNYKAFEIIYYKYSTLLFNSGYAIIKDKEACEDILQDAFINIWISRQHLEIHSLKAYLLKSMRNQVLTYLRKRRPHLSLESIENHVATFCQIEKNLSDKNALNDIYKKIDTLPAKCREIFILSRQYQLSNKEISDKLNISIKTVENQITIAIRKLKPFTEKAYFLIFVVFVRIITNKF